MSRVDVRVPQPGFDGIDLNPRLQKVHGGCVAQGVRADFFVQQRGAAPGGPGCVFADDIADAEIDMKMKQKAPEGDRPPGLFASFSYRFRHRHESC